ncbi:hypothetical protein EDD11_002141 [Mortierella claussenii]|nr:hypothetical protein EDD11_002141 [Mortierella claussenii]
MSSSVTLEPSKAAASLGYVSDRRPAIQSLHSMDSRPQTKVGNVGLHELDEFTASEFRVGGSQRKITDHSTALMNQDDDHGIHTGSVSPPSLPRQSNDDGASILSKSRRKRNFWSSFPRKFSFRPKGAIRPKNANSFGNKKAMFSNERTMVHWIKAAMLLGSLAMTLLSFGQNEVTPYIGLILLVICLLTLIYSNTVFQVRMEWLSMRRDDVVYYDRLAPTLLTVCLMVTFGFNAVVMYNGTYDRNHVYFKHSNKV